MTCYALPFAGVILLTTISAADARLSLKDLEGTWQMVSVTRNGNTAPAELIKKGKVVLTIEKDAYTVTAADQVVEKGKLKLDETAKPATLDQLIEEGKDKGKTHKSIIRIEDGKLQWSQGDAGQDRPTEFASPRGRKDSFAEFERVK